MKTLITDRRVVTRLQVTEGQAKISYRLVGRNVPRFIWSDRPTAVSETALWRSPSESVPEALGTLSLFPIVVQVSMFLWTSLCRNEKISSL